MVLSSEIGNPLEIQAFSWHKAPITTTDADCEGFSIHMGYCSSDTLSPDSFEGNYIAGTKTLVYSTPLLSVDMADEWAQIDLDTPFFFNGTDNLIIEIQWDNGTEDNSYYNWQWDTGTARCIFQQETPDINTSTFLPHMYIIGLDHLENTTFADVKVEIGQ